MGQKVNPCGLRVGIIRDWNSRWYANNKDFSKYLNDDIKIREFLNKRLKECMVSHIEIERVRNGKITVSIFSSRPGMILGQDASNIKMLTKTLQKMLGKKENELKVSVVEVKDPSLDANIVAQEMAYSLEQRASFRSVQKQIIRKVMKAGAQGIKTKISGRLGGAEIARSEGYKEGVVSLHTLRMDVDYACAEARTTYGKLGCKVWICRGLATRNDKAQEETSEAPRNARARKGE